MRCYVGPVSMHSDRPVWRLARTACLCEVRFGGYTHSLATMIPTAKVYQIHDSTLNCMVGYEDLRLKSTLIGVVECYGARVWSGGTCCGITRISRARTHDASTLFV